MKKSILDKLQNVGDIATNAATNAYLAAGALEGINYLDKMDYSSTTQALAAGAAAVGIGYLNKKGLIKKASKTINDSVRNIKGKAMPYIRNIALTGFLTGAAILAGKQVNTVYNDFINKDKTEETTGINKKWDGKRKAEKSLETHVGPYQTIQQTKNIPAIIVESFFGSNENDLKYFMNEKNRDKFCDNIVNGIEKYVGSDSTVEMITIAGGHGENDWGAKYGPEGKIHEADFNKEMSKDIADKLKQKGYNVQHLWYTGSGDQKDRLKNYVSNANKYSGKSVYVEMHTDAAGPDVAGSRVYGPKPKNENPKSHKFGKVVLDEINKSW